MTPGAWAQRNFFWRPTAAVARDLVGARIVMRDGVTAEIVEVEAYLGTDDAASHAWRGPTPRSAIMFGEPGHLCVYRSYGVHWCANVVTESPGTAGAVLLRAARVMSGASVVRGRRGDVAEARLLSGPGNLSRGLGIAGTDNGMDVCAPAAALRLQRGFTPVLLDESIRVGISRNIEAVLRFSLVGSPAVSAPSPKPRLLRGARRESRRLPSDPG